jgi:hypothetical protein
VLTVLLTSVEVSAMPDQPEYRLQQLTVRCPITQRQLPTGITLNAVAFATAVFRNVRVPCPHCEGEHRWSTADAFLVEYEGGIPPPESQGRYSFGPGPKKAPRPRPVETE